MPKRSSSTKKKVTKKSAMKKRVVSARTMKVATRVTPKKVVKKVEAPKPATVQHNKKIRKIGFSLSSMKIGIQMLVAFSAVGVIFLLGTVDQNIFSTRQSDAQGTVALVRNTATIGLSYTRPLSLGVLVARNAQGALYTSIENNGNETITVNVPSDWRRQEVSGTTLENVVAGVPTFGFTAWSLPAHATIKLSAASVPDALFFDTDAESTAAITLQTVRVEGEDSAASQRVILVQKNALVPLWVQE